MVQWLEIKSTDKEALEAAAQKYQIHPLALEDCINRDQRAKLEDYGNHQFLVWFMLSHETIYEIQFIIFPDQLILVPHEDPPVGETWGDYFRVNCDGSKDVQHLLYQVLDKATDITWQHVRVLFQQIDDFEQQMFVAESDPLSLMELKKQLNWIDFSIGHLPSVTEQLQNFYRAKDDLRWRLRDLHDHCQRTSHNIAMYRSQIASTIELFWGHEANKTNFQIKRLSVIASIAVPLTFWASFWGMNFDALPFHSENAFYVAMGLMVLSVAGTAFYLKKRGYF